MDDITEALTRGGIADITTIGKRSGLERRIEIYFHHFDGEFYLTGRPGRPRDWMANLRANSVFTLHPKRGVSADLSAHATEITDEEERGRVLFRALTESWGAEPAKAHADLERWVTGSPLVRFSVDRSERH